MTTIVETTVIVRYTSQEGAIIPQESMIPTAAGINMTGMISTRNFAVSLMADKGSSRVFNRKKSSIMQESAEAAAHAALPPQRRLPI